MQSTITGKAYVLGDNVDTDQIIPAQYLTFNPSIPEEYKQFGKYALSSVPPSQAGLPKGHVPFHQGDEFVSAFKIIVRNLYIPNSRPRNPMRRCTKIAGPLLVRRMSSMTTSMSGANNTISSSDPTTSMSRFTRAAAGLRCWRSNQNVPARVSSCGWRCTVRANLLSARPWATSSDGSC